MTFTALLTRSQLRLAAIAYVTGISLFSNSCSPVKNPCDDYPDKMTKLEYPLRELSVVSGKSIDLEAVDIGKCINERYGDIDRYQYHNAARDRSGRTLFQYFSGNTSDKYYVVILDPHAAAQVREFDSTFGPVF